MFKKITEKLVARLKLNLSWEKMIGIDDGITGGSILYEWWCRGRLDTLRYVEK